MLVGKLGVCWLGSRNKPVVPLSPQPVDRRRCCQLSLGVHTVSTASHQTERPPLCTTLDVTHARRAGVSATADDCSIN